MNAFVLRMYASVVVWADRLGKELHIQVGMGMLVTSGSLYGVMVEHWPGMWDSHFHLAHNTGFYGHNPVPAMHSMVVEPTLCMYM